MSMKNIFESVINKGAYNLTDIIDKAHEEYIANRLTKEERDEIIVLAQGNAKPENNYSEINARIDKIFEDISILNKTVSANAKEIVAIKEAIEKIGATVPPTEEPTEEEWPEWYAWDGVTLNPWQDGSKCTHNGVRYISKVDNNIWEPGAIGVHDFIWEKQAE